ncbi:monovalent cation/H+ antiporter complex subunit F [Streptomyces sp. NPDC002676]
MNAWLAGAAVLATLGMPPCLWAVARGSAHERLAGLNLATAFATVLFLLTAQGVGRSSYADSALVLAVLGPAGTLVFARLLGGRSSDAEGTGRHGEA